MSRVTSTVVAATLLLSFFAGGCMPPSAKLSPLQKRHITSKLIAGSFEDTYRAALTIFQDQDYMIRNTDMQAGLIVAYVDRAASASTQAAGSLVGILVEAGSGVTTTAGAGFELSCIVNKISETTSEVRLSIHESAYNSMSSGGVRNQKTTQIYDAEVFQNFFDQLTIEVKRRQAMI